MKLDWIAYMQKFHNYFLINYLMIFAILSK